MKHPDDGTQALLRAGFGMLATGLLALLLLVTVFGGYSETGARTNMGWIALIFVLMCIPFGGLIALLGTAKWFRLRRQSKQ